MARAVIIGSQGGRGLWGSLILWGHATGGGSTFCQTAHVVHGICWVHHSTEARRISTCTCCAQVREGW